MNASLDSVKSSSSAYARSGSARCRDSTPALAWKPSHQPLVDAPRASRLGEGVGDLRLARSGARGGPRGRSGLACWCLLVGGGGSGWGVRRAACATTSVGGPGRGAATARGDPARGRGRARPGRRRPGWSAAAARSPASSTAAVPAQPGRRAGVPQVLAEQRPDGRRGARGSGPSGVARGERLERRPGRPGPGGDRVVDALAGHRVDQPGGVAGEQHRPARAAASASPTAAAGGPASPWPPSVAPGSSASSRSSRCARGRPARRRRWSSSPYPTLVRPSPRSKAQAYDGWRAVPNTMHLRAARGRGRRGVAAEGDGRRPGRETAAAARTTEWAPSAPTTTARRVPAVDAHPVGAGSDLPHPVPAQVGAGGHGAADQPLSKIGARDDPGGPAPVGRSTPRSPRRSASGAQRRPVVDDVPDAGVRAGGRRRAGRCRRRRTCRAGSRRGRAAPPSGTGRRAAPRARSRRRPDRRPPRPGPRTRPRPVPGAPDRAGGASVRRSWGTSGSVPRLGLGVRGPDASHAMPGRQSQASGRRPPTRLRARQPVGGPSGPGTPTWPGTVPARVMEWAHG